MGKIFDWLNGLWHTGGVMPQGKLNGLLKDEVPILIPGCGRPVVPHHDTSYEMPEIQFIRHRQRAKSDAKSWEPPGWPNGCHRRVPEALRYLAENDRPEGGEQWYNRAHLQQLADEIEQASTNATLQAYRICLSIAQHWQEETVIGDGKQWAASEIVAAINDLIASIPTHRQAKGDGGGKD